MNASSNLDRLEKACARFQALEPDETAEAHVDALEKCFTACPMVACVLPKTAAIRLRGGKPTEAHRKWLSAVASAAAPPEAFPASLKLNGVKPIVARLAAGNRRIGDWVLAAGPEDFKQVEAELWGLARAAACVLTGSEIERALAECRQSVAEQRQLCVLADLIGPVAHELQNVLNSMLLQAAIVERSAPPEIKDDLSKIRSLGIQAGEVMKRFNQYRYGQSTARYSVDVNKMLSARIGDLEGESVRVETTFIDRPLLVRANRTDVERLAELLLKQAMDSTASRNPDGSVRCETKVEDGRVLLIVEDSGGAIADVDLKGLFQTSGTTRSGTNTMELLACQSLARRLGGVLKAESTEMGLRVSAEFELAASPASDETEA